MEKALKKRDSFTSGFGVLMATISAAVGLGNIWKFPALTGSNGGASFLLVYLLATFLVGLPIMLCEIAMGRTGKSNMVTTIIKLTPNRRPWWLIGIIGVVAATLIMAFYTEVSGWVFAYVAKAISGSAATTNAVMAKEAFTELVSSPWKTLLWQWIVLIFIGTIITFGVTRGIEAITKKLTPILFVLLIGLCIYSLTLPGAAQGLHFLFYPDLSKLNAQAIMSALGLAFFKLSIGMGCMMTYGSYFGSDQNIPLTATRVMFADLLVSLLAGIAIFPAVFTFGFTPDAGASLVFMTIPTVFAQLPFGSILMVLFFILTAIAATGAMLSILEVPVSVVSERYNLSRAKATILMLAVIALLGAPAALSSNIMADIRLFNMQFFDLYDFVSCDLLLPLAGLGTAIFVGWVWGFKNWHAAISNEGTLKNITISRMFFFLVKYIAPLAVIIILLRGLHII